MDTLIDTDFDIPLSSAEIRQILRENAQLRKQVSELQFQLAQKDQIIASLSAQLAALKAIVDDLAAQNKQNSANSHKPPSSDMFSKPSPKSLRTKTGKLSGGQKGHVGVTLLQSATPSEIKKEPFTKCPNCQGSLENEPVLSVSKRQVFDIPPVDVHVTEYQAELKHCACCAKNVWQEFPENIDGPVQFGPRVRALVLYLNAQNHIPEDRLQAVLKDIFNIEMSTATISNILQRAYEGLESFEAESLELIKAANIKHADESGFRAEGSRKWLHVFCSERATYYHVDNKRSYRLPGITGTIVHDNWLTYWKYTDAQHALCNQHHQRELLAVFEGPTKEKWANNMSRLLVIALRISTRYKDTEVPANKLALISRFYDAIVAEGLALHASLPALPQKAKGGEKKRKGHNLCLRFKNRKKEVLLFLHDSSVPFTNNLAERDIRMLKCRQKVSGGFRTTHGARIFARLRGFMSTIRKQKLELFPSILTLFDPSLPRLPALT